MSRILLVFFLFSFSGFSQGVLGKWKTVNAKDGESKCIVEIYEKEGKVFGKIIEILNPEDKNAICTKCTGEDKDKPILGFELIKNMTKSGKYYKNGTIFDPENGKEYKCRLALTEDPNVLQVRGYISFLYATQYWVRES
ncbi:uncharacterized protein (DUF2147 family) [Lacinutrix venerupis]|uniref:DUF2147 domain-containing protein n=1 Tax=Lacinutrix venerupis TaxID=1486034 RepID=UPI000EAC8DE6|nr:DUF2147 domain-containing protein [Lacinutrix venerupis]RLJ62599.1 uncharacterized protein (DUF2147 family) [Lacinutrix venerupis]